MSNVPENVSESIQFSRDMGITHADFFRLLPKAVNGRTYSVEQNKVNIVEAERQVVLSLSPQGERVIASLRLPTTRVDFAFSNYSKAEVDRFMAHFELYFRRGGG